MNISDNEPEIVKPSIFARVRGWFFTGLLVTAPVLLTVYITWAAIELIDGQVNKLIPAFSTWSLGDIPGGRPPAPEWSSSADRRRRLAEKSSSSIGSGREVWSAAVSESALGSFEQDLSVASFEERDRQFL